MSEFAKRFKDLREARGMTQEKIAEVLGVSRSTIAGYESEEKNRIPREETLTKIANLFRTSIDYLLGRSDEPNNNNIDSNSKVRPGGEELREYIVQGLSNEQIKKRGDLYVAFLALNDEQTDEFLNFARDQIFKNLNQQSAAAASRSEET